MHRILTLALTASLLIASLGGQVAAQDDVEASPAASAVPSPAASFAASLEDSTMPRFESAKWKKLNLERGPGAREDQTWTVDLDGAAAYLFGGRDGGKAYDDLWRFDLATDSWKRLKPSGPTPSARFGHSAVWVEGVGLIVFAGQRGTDFFGDLWAYDPSRNRWKLLPDRGEAPRKRYGSCAIVGPDGRLWISHGFTFIGRFDDTRAYNFKSERWANIAPDGRRPGKRCLHDCFTSLSGQLVLYGGQNDSVRALGDLWVTRPNGSWVKRSDPRPRARRLYAVTEAGDYAFIFGGAGKDDAALDDLWRVDRETFEFSRVRVAGASPAGRSAGTLITDRERGRLLLFGGKAKAAKADLWQLTDTSAADADDADADDADADASTVPGPSTAPAEVPEEA
jgi:N-acetylneuraminic acid mutarotase